SRHDARSGSQTLGTIMATQSTRRGRRSWAVYLIIALVVVFLGLFLFELLTFGISGAGAGSPALSDDEILALIADANPENGAQLVVQFACTACHVDGAEKGIAPPFEGLSVNAASRQPELSPEVYLYRS